MYNNGVLPNTGITTVGFGLTANGMVCLGICITIIGLVLFKLLRFKVKDVRR